MGLVPMELQNISTKNIMRIGAGFVIFLVLIIIAFININLVFLIFIVGAFILIRRFVGKK